MNTQKIYSVPSMEKLPEEIFPKTRQVIILINVINKENRTTSMILIPINWLRLQPSMMFCRWVLKLNSFTINMMMIIPGKYKSQLLSQPTVCHTFGNANESPRSIEASGTWALVRCSIYHAIQVTIKMLTRYITAKTQKARQFFIFSHSIFKRCNIVMFEV